MNVDQSSDLLVILGSQPQDSGARLGYADIAIGKDRSMADTFRSASEDASVAKADLMAQRDAQDALQAEVNRRKEAAEGAVAAQQSALAKVRVISPRWCDRSRLGGPPRRRGSAGARQQQSRSGAPPHLDGGTLDSRSVGRGGRSDLRRAQPARCAVPMGGLDARLRL